MYASAVRLAVMKFVATMSATADVLALASLEVDLQKVEIGTTATVKWRGECLFNTTCMHICLFLLSK